MNTDELNLQNYKNDSEELKKLKTKLVRILPTGLLIEELKRRKIISIDWLKGGNYYKENDKPNN